MKLKIIYYKKGFKALSQVMKLKIIYYKKGFKAL